MADTKSSLSEKDMERIAKLRLIDDEFLSEALDGKITPVQEIVNTILERTDLKVISTRSQVSYKNTAKRSIRLDIKAEMADGEIVDIEIQRADQGAGARRARFYSSMIDRAVLNAGDSFDQIPDIYVIFITENDIYKRGLPSYHVDRYISELEYTPFNDGSHIIHVNGQFRDETHPIGRLMHDFFCTRAEDMLNPLLAEEVRYLKETEEGQGQMSRIFEEMREEAAREAEYRKTIQIARQMLSKGIAEDVVSDCTGLALDVVMEISGEKSA